MLGLFYKAFRDCLTLFLMMFGAFVFKFFACRHKLKEEKGLGKTWYLWVQFNGNMFIGLLQQERFSKLYDRKIWAEKVFNLPPNGPYRDFVENMENRGLGSLSLL